MQVEQAEPIASKVKEQSKRECGMLVTVASQGGGKTYQNKLLIVNYVKDKKNIRVRGRKVLILDSNGEYATNTFGIDGIPPLEVKRIAVKDIKAWCRSDIVECRRVDMKSLPIEDKMKIVNYAMQVFRNGLVVMEDINSVCLDMTHMKNIVSSLVNLRHKAADVIVSYQSLRKVEPTILSNCRYVRMHYMVGDVDDVKGKLSEPDVFKIAQFIVNKKFYSGDKRFFVYVHTNPHKIEGMFSRADFIEAAKKLLMTNKRRLKEEQDISGCTMETALQNQSEQLCTQFYGNKS